MPSAITDTERRIAKALAAVLNGADGLTRMEIQDYLSEIGETVDMDDLSSTSTGLGAALIGVEDSAANFAGTTVETVLAEIISDYAATTASNGASKIGIEDSAAIITATTVEGALAEIQGDLDAAEANIVTLQAGILAKRQLVVGHADLTDADTSQTINLGATLPANARIMGVSVHTVTAFSGGTVSALALDIGTSGDVDAIVDGSDLFAAAVDGQAATLPAGIAPNKLFVAAGAQLIGTFVSTGDNLVNLDAGAATIDVLFMVLA